MGLYGIWLQRRYRNYILFTDRRIDGRHDRRTAGRRTKGYRISSTGLWPVELKTRNPRCVCETFMPPWPSPKWPWPIDLLGNRVCAPENDLDPDPLTCQARGIMQSKITFILTHWLAEQYGSYSSKWPWLWHIDLPIDRDHLHIDVNQCNNLMGLSILQL